MTSVKKIVLIAGLLLNPFTAVSAIFPFIQSTYQRTYADEKPIVVVIPSYNNMQWIKYNLTSVLMQNYKNYHVIYIADGCGTQSYDGTGEQAEQILHDLIDSGKGVVIKNTEKKGALYNLYHAIYSCPDEVIIVTLDGDDWFYDADVLSRINDTYHQDIWLTHGTFIEYPTGINYWSEQLPKNIIAERAFRTHRCPSHLRTFYAWLFKKIKVNDLLDADGNFYPMTWDQAIMFPMLEMAGEKHAFIKDAIYVYNMANQLNDNKVNAQLQRNLEKEIRAKTRYKKIK